MISPFHRFRSCLLVGTAFAAAAIPTAAAAEDAASRHTIIVTGEGLAQTPATPAYGVQEIDEEQITSSASGRIEDVLSSIAGFQQFRRSDSRSSNPSAQGVTLRALGGNATSRALVLLDGVPMANPFFGYMPLSAIAPERLRSVRVTRGGGTGAFGSGAVAGTIELTSADARALGLFHGSALVNDRAESELSATIAPELGQGFVIASARWDRGKGFWTTPATDRVPASARARYDSWSASLRAVAPLTDSIELQASGLVFDDRRTLRFDGADSSSSGQDASVRLVGRGDWQFDALAYVQARDFSNIVISSTRFVRVLDQRRTPSTGLGGKLELRPPLGEDHVMRFGADLRITDGELQEEPYSAFSGLLTERRRAGGRNSDIGFFLEDDWTIGPVVLTAGARADRWTVKEGFYRAVDASGVVIRHERYPDRSGWDASFRGGAVLNAGGGLSLRAAAYSGVRLPTLNELYRPFVVFPVTTNANAALRNEKLRGVEAGLDFAPSENVRLSVTAFDNKVKNAVANVTLTPTERQRQNVDAVHSRGLEFGAGLRFGTVSFDGSLALTDAEVEGSGASAALDGMRPAQTPKVAASGTLAWRPREGWYLSATLRHVGAQYEDDLQTDVLPAATTLDAYAELPVGEMFSLVLRGENLTDETIVTRNQGGSMDLGVPRSVWAGIKVRLP
ncbi:MAG: TonB-dependent receptor [Novosphingobium sp.]|nr:TonB-dependent receptor [Novosphingobium sp.]MCP5401518.1 TonB-dependent receptor [Novosphingobium sp.]